jgi:hypothetical protein
LKDRPTQSPWAHCLGSQICTIKAGFRFGLSLWDEIHGVSSSSVHPWGSVPLLRKWDAAQEAEADDENFDASGVVE